MEARLSICILSNEMNTHFIDIETGTAIFLLFLSVGLCQPIARLMVELFFKE